MASPQRLHLETAATSGPIHPVREELTAEVIAQIGAWARAHDTTFAHLVYEWIDRGGLRALAQHLGLSPATPAPRLLPVTGQVVHPARRSSPS